MKRMKVLGLCLVAAFAFSALVASAAFAVDPEYQICGKAAKSGKLYIGKYSEKTCAKEASPAEITEGKKNKYEREEISKAKKKGFKGKNSGAPHNNIVNVFGEKKGGPSEPAVIEGTTTCQKEKVTGENTGAKTTTWHTEYSKCSAVVAKIPTECNTKEKKKGDIDTDQLSSTLVNLDKGPGHKKVGIRVKGGGPGGRLAQYECLEGGLNVEVFGEILAEVKGNLNSAEKATEDAAAEGPLKLQGYTYEEEAMGSLTADEETAKGFWEYGYGLAACEKGEEPFPPGTHTQAECEVFLGGPPPPAPINLTSVITGAQNATAPGVQNGVSVIKGEDELIADN
jgi:hypothetical protein